MRYWVQYHKEDMYGLPYGDGFAIDTNKVEVFEALNHTIFLIVGLSENPKQYLLWERFVCDEVSKYDDTESRFKYFATGKNGWKLKQRSDQALLNKWKSRFQEYLNFTGNFHIGFHEVTDHPFLDILLQISEQCKPNISVKLDKINQTTNQLVEEIENTNNSNIILDELHNLEKPQIEQNNEDVSQDTDAETKSADHAEENSVENLAEDIDEIVFSDSISNQEVEKSAIKFVTIHYENLGWEVLSVESENVGFDLLCSKGNDYLDIEVKGLSGKGAQFVISPNEVNESKNNSNWHLAVVNLAISDRPILQIYSSIEFREQFKLEVLNYVAKPKT